MLYVKIDTRALTNGKFLAAGPLAFALYVKGLLYAKEHMTDGMVPHAVIPLLTLGMPDPAGVVAEMLRVGLWTEVEGGYTVGADRWAEFQTTKAQVEQSRGDAAERKRRSRERSKSGHADVTRDTVVTHEVCHADVTLPEPEPEPEPEPYILSPDASTGAEEDGDHQDDSTHSKEEYIPWYENPEYPNKSIQRVAQRIAATKVRSQSKPFPYRDVTEAQARKALEYLADCPDAQSEELFWGSWDDYHSKKTKGQYTRYDQAIGNWAAKRKGEWATARRLQGSKPRSDDYARPPVWTPGGAA